jgi:ribosomal protein S18 acetylase RimI-like enzyme
MAEMTIRMEYEVDSDELYPLIMQLNPTMSRERFNRLYTDMIMSGRYKFITARADDNRLLGVMGIWLNSKFFCGAYMEIDNFVIDKDHRGQGIGKRIMEYALNYARDIKCDSVSLDVFRENADANALYERYGFEKPGYHRILWINEDVKREYGNAH